jgi:hypothetical protein
MNIELEWELMRERDADFRDFIEIDSGRNVKMSSKPHPHHQRVNHLTLSSSSASMSCSCIFSYEERRMKVDWHRLAL